MPRFEFKPDINAGNIITLVMLVVSLAVAYAQLKSRVEEIHNYVSRLEARQSATDAKLENVKDVASTRQEMIMSRLLRLEVILERLEKKVSP